MASTDQNSQSVPKWIEFITWISNTGQTSVEEGTAACIVAAYFLREDPEILKSGRLTPGKVAGFSCSDGVKRYVLGHLASIIPPGEGYKTKTCIHWKKGQDDPENHSGCKLPSKNCKWKHGDEDVSNYIPPIYNTGGRGGRGTFSGGRGAAGRGAAGRGRGAAGRGRGAAGRGGR